MAFGVHMCGCNVHTVQVEWRQSAVGVSCGIETCDFLCSAPLLGPAMACLWVKWDDAWLYQQAFFTGFPPVCSSCASELWLLRCSAVKVPLLCGWQQYTDTSALHGHIFPTTHQNEMCEGSINIYSLRGVRRCGELGLHHTATPSKHRDKGPEGWHTPPHTHTKAATHPPKPPSALPQPPGPPLALLMVPLAGLLLLPAHPHEVERVEAVCTPTQVPGHQTGSHQQACWCLPLAGWQSGAMPPPVS